MNRSDSRDSVSQLADLRTRIAAVVRQHPQSDEWGIPQEECRNCKPFYGMDYAQHVADAVICELGLHLQPAKGHYRYVTDWVADG